MLNSKVAKDYPVTVEVTKQDFEKLLRCTDVGKFEKLMHYGLKASTGENIGVQKLMV
jgi:hypothetical protein